MKSKQIISGIVAVNKLVFRGPKVIFQDIGGDQFAAHLAPQVITQILGRLWRMGRSARYRNFGNSVSV